MSGLLRVTDWVCPIEWAGETHEIDDMVVFACVACNHPADCASNGSCERADECQWEV